MEQELTNQKEMIEKQRAEVLRLQQEYEDSRESPEPEVDVTTKKREPSIGDDEGEISKPDAPGNPLIVSLTVQRSYSNTILTVSKVYTRAYVQYSYILSRVIKHYFV